MNQPVDSPTSAPPANATPREALVTAAPADVLNATLDRDEPLLGDGDPLPPGWHWLYFPEVVRISDTGPDGHARQGDLLPETGLPYRMWAGNRMRFQRQIRVGERIHRRQWVSAITHKQSPAGPLCFVTVTSEIATSQGVATVEELDLVYRGPRSEGGSRRREPDRQPQWSRTVVPGPVLLFRFSALTMNSHRIHYDHPYATGEEGYPGLVVHGPLLMILLLDLLRRELPSRPPCEASVRAMRPLFDDRPFRIEGVCEGDTAHLWVAGDDGGLAMQGQAVVGDAQRV